MIKSWMMLRYTTHAFFLLMLLFGASELHAQNKLSVEGNAQIKGTLSLQDDSSNVFLGNLSGINQTGSSNIGIGSGFLLNNEAKDNIAVGFEPLRFNTLGEDNIAIGNQALRANTEGSLNIAIGNRVLRDNITGRGNVGVGISTLEDNETGDHNTALGFAISFLGDSFSNSMALGFNTIITTPNQIRLGNPSIVSIGGYEPWSTISDQRLKHQIRADIPGLDFIARLRPVSYQLDMTNISKWHHTPDSLRDFKSEAVKGNIRYSGFLAQEVEATAQEIGYDFSGVDQPKNEKDRYGLRYSQFVVPLVKAVQELNAEKQIAEDRITHLEREVEELKALVLATKNVELRSNNKRASLSQNTPNPFNEYTTIQYFIPDGFRQAMIRIADHNGKLIKDIGIAESGAGKVEIEATQLRDGNYFYYLILDGKLVDSKQMIQLNNDR
ncbi:MAG: tail fiber domain-containing protein [Bacteroidota bacterium]